MRIEAVPDEAPLDIQGLMQHNGVNGFSIMAMDPYLAHLNISLPVTIYFGSRGPHVLG